MNNDWAIEQLRRFIQSTQVVARDGYGVRHAASNEEIEGQAQVVEQIFARIIPDWKDRTTAAHYDHWENHCTIARRALAQLERQQEISENLGESAPDLSAAQMHRWIWDSARSLWESGHFREAVAAAAVKVNAETQNKVGRYDISEVKLFQESFSIKPPQAKKARLRLMPDDGSETYTSMQAGVIAFATGCYQAIRNPTAHVPGKLSEAEALEQLASFSVLARWVDGAELDEV